MRTWMLLVLLITLGVSNRAWSSPSDPQFYTFNQTTTNNLNWASEGSLSDQSPHPYNLLTLSGSLAKRAELTLLKWASHHTSLPTPSEKYSRRAQYGSWVRGYRDGQCYNTRARVLIRDSDQPVEFRQNNPCIVDSGSWFDEFSGQWVFRASDLQIDHVVPVKVSYDLGGFKWSKQKRCMFFNYLEDPDHLVPIGISENAKKGARPPHQYMPMNKPFWCSYLRKWLRVKMVWDLPILPEEASTIREAIREGQCNLADFQISYRELDELRSQIFDTNHSCNRLRGRVLTAKKITEDISDLGSTEEYWEP